MRALRVALILLLVVAAQAQTVLRGNNSSVGHGQHGGAVALPTAATPTFVPSSGTVPQTVTISSSTVGSSSYIYWNTTGNPTVSDNHGTSVSVSVDPTTVYAKVIGMPGYNDSAVGSATYSGTAAAGSWLPGYNSGSPISGWYELSNTAFRGSTPDVRVPDAYSGASWGLVADVMTDWGGGAYDTSRHRMMIFGGGHGGYGGNEVYALDISSNTGGTAPKGVFRLTNPCPTWTADADPICTNKPNARHTYFGLVYSAARDALLIFDGGLYGTGSANGNIAWSLDLTTLPALDGATHVPSNTTAKPSTETWSQRGTLSSVSGQDVTSIADPGATMVARSGHFYMGNQHKVVDYNDTTGAFAGSTITDTMNGTSYYAVWVYSSLTPNLVWHVGKTELEKLDVTTGVHTAVSPASVTGCTFSNVVNASGPAVAYDTTRNVVVFWLGGGTVYEWTPAASGGTCVARSFTNTLGCATWDANGIYGRWAYDPTYNVFVAWSNNTANACIWRP